jgi:3-hydroxyisobutyrate dehydrogenase-like beta-hydroxyacid dehydrogenase
MGNWRTMGEGDFRSHVLKVKLTDKEYALLQAEAARTGKPMAALLREAFLGTLADLEGREDEDRGN